MWRPDISSAKGPKYASISKALSRDIRSGRLQAGDRLPPQRELAEALGVDLGTVTRAYSEVREMGLISGDGRRGSYVLPIEAPSGYVDDVEPFLSGMNLTPITSGGRLAARIAQDTQAILAGASADYRLQYQPPGGAPLDRRTGAEWLAQRGIESEEDRILITSGGQNALHAIAHSALKPGDAVCTGRFVYPGWLAIARRRGLETIPVLADGEGLIPESIAQACQRGPIRAIYVVPSNDNPTTVTMGAKRRADLVEVARQNDLLIIEDDAYGLLAQNPLSPIASLAPERTWYVASLSKIISPALRVAYLHAPTSREAWQVTTDLHETSVMPPQLSVALATRWIRNGSLADLISEVRQACASRQDLVRQTLQPGSYNSDPAGFHLWVPLREGASALEFTGAMALLGVQSVSSEVFAAMPGEQMKAIRISVGGDLTPQQIQRALSRVDAMLHRNRAVPIV